MSVMLATSTASSHFMSYVSYMDSFRVALRVTVAIYLHPQSGFESYVSYMDSLGGALRVTLAVRTASEWL